MKIINLETCCIKVPVKKTFVTSIRRVHEIDTVLVKINTDSEFIGIGEASPTAEITGETKASILAAINSYIKPAIEGMEVLEFEPLMHKLHNCISGNASAKAACDIALYDLMGKFYGKPLRNLLGGYRRNLHTDITISLNDTDTMVKDALEAVDQGFDIIKLKVGESLEKDIERVRSIRSAVNSKIKIRLDANQGWSPKEAIAAIDKLVKYDIELVEQPVNAKDLYGLKQVTDSSPVMIMADESLFSIQDAFKLLSIKAVDLLNIKLMKCGGIYNAIKISNIAEAAGIKCMMGSMMESKVSVTAAAHLAAALKNIEKYDLDAAFLLEKDPVIGGINYDGSSISFSEGNGLGIDGIVQE